MGRFICSHLSNKNRLLAEIDCQCALNQRRAVISSSGEAASNPVRRFAEGWVEGGFRRGVGSVEKDRLRRLPLPAFLPARWTIYLHLSLVANTEPSDQTVEQLEAQMTFIYKSRTRERERAPRRARHAWGHKHVMTGRVKKFSHLVAAACHTLAHTQGMIMFGEREQNDLCGW